MAEEKKRRKRRAFTKEFKADVARMCRTESIADVSRSMGLLEKSVRLWVKQAEIDAGKGPPEALTTGEHEEDDALFHHLPLPAALTDGSEPIQANLAFIKKGPTGRRNYSSKFRYRSHPAREFR